MRRILVFLLLILPSVALAAPCCDEPVDECCDTAGACPVSPEGECALREATPTVIPASVPVTALPEARHEVPGGPPLLIATDTETPAVEPTSSVPIYLVLASLRI